MGKRERKISRFTGRWITEQGAGTVEYVIVVLVAIVIGSGLMAFGNQISGQVTKTGNSISSWFSKADGTGGTGGGDNGADSRIDELKEKDPADWTLDDQKVVAEDIEKKGNSSELYSKAKDAMDAGTEWSIGLSNSKTMTYRIIGINHDDLADSSGKAGLTFEATNDALGEQRMNATNINAGGWEKSELRGRLNSGDLWALLPSEIQSKAKAVTKMTDNQGGGSVGTPSTTTDKVFLLSASEVYGNIQSDGTQYEVYKSKGVSTSSYSGASSGLYHWTRSVGPSWSTGFRCVHEDGDWGSGTATSLNNVLPAFCF